MRGPYCYGRRFVRRRYNMIDEEVKKVAYSKSAGTTKSTSLSRVVVELRLSDVKEVCELLRMKSGSIMLQGELR